MFGGESCWDSIAEIEPNVKLECVPKFCNLDDTLGAGGGVDEAARAGVRCAWAKYKELSSITDSDSLRCIISHEKNIFQGLCPECVDIWNRDMGTGH